MSIKKLLEAQQATLRQQDQIAKKNGGSLNTGMTSQEYAQYANNLVTGGAGINNAYGLTDDQKYGYTKDDNWITSSVKFLGGGQADLVNLQNEDKNLIQSNLDGFNAFRRGAAQATLTGMNAFSSMGDTSVADNLLGSIDAATLSAYYAEKSGKGNAQTKALLDKRYQNDLYNYSIGEAGNFNKMSTRDIITKGLQAKESAARINGGNGYGDGRYGAQGYYGQGAIAKHNEIKEANRKEWNVAGIEKEAELDWSKGNYLKGGLKHTQAMLASGASSIESVMDDSTILSQTLGEQLPTMAVLAATRGRGAAGKTFGYAAVASDNVSRAHSTRNQEELKLFEERQGNVTQNERTALKAMAYGHAALDFVGDKLTAKAFGGDNVAGTTIQKLIQKGKNAATATISEGITEGIQTHIETNGFRLRNEFNAAAVGEGAAMGAMAGGVYGSAPFVTGATGAAVSKAAEKAAPTVGNAAGHFGNFVKAFKAKGTMEDQLNPENADTYNPANVVSQSLKTQRNTNATAEDLANSNNNIQDAMDITTASLQDIDDLITQRKSNETRLSDIEQQATELMTWLEENSIDKQDVDAMSDNELDNFVTNYEKQETLFESLTREHGELDNSLNTSANLDSLFQQKQKLTIDAENVLNQVTRATEADIKRNRVTDIDATLQTVNEDNQNDLVSKILSAPNLYTTEDFDKLINNSVISEDNKVLLRAFKDSFSANEKASRMDVVNSHVIKGNKKLNKDGKQSFVGLNDYTARISAALNMGNKSSAEYQLDLLDNFNQSHQGKSKAITEAFNRAESAGTNFYVIPQQDGKWGVTDSLDGITPKELRDAGGFDIHRGSAALVGQVSAEAKAIQASYDALSKLIDSGLVKPAVRTKPSATRTNVVAAAEAVSSETKAEVEAILKEETRENVIKAKEVVTKAKQAKAKQEMGIEETPVNALRGNQPKPIKPIKVPKDFEGRTPSKEVPTYNTDDFTGFKNKEWISGIVKTLNRMNDGKQGVNRFIGFNNSATNGRTDNINLLTEHFRGKDMANITQSYGADYKPSDVVAVGVPFAKQANADKYLITPTDKPAYKRNGMSVDTDAINKSKAMYKELYSAAYSGAAILLLSGNAKQNAQQGYVTAQVEIEQFLKDMGYQKGGYTRSGNQNDQSLWILPDVTVVDGKTHKATVTQEQEVEEELDIEGEDIVVNEVEETPKSKATSLQPQDIVLYSGGAYGSDSAWDVGARMVGIDRIVHLTGTENKVASKGLRNNGVKATQVPADKLAIARAEIKKLTGRDLKDDFIGNLHARNYYQVIKANDVMAISTLTNNKKAVTGGTNTAVQVGIALGKNVHVWDTATQGWFTWNGNVFVKSNTPKITGNFAGVGTRDIENYITKDKKTGAWVNNPKYLGDEIRDAAHNAINDVFSKTFSEGNTEVAIPEATEATGEVTTEINTNTPEDNQAAVTESVDPLEDNGAATDTVDTVTPVEDAIEAPTIESLNLSEADILAERQVPIQKRNRVKAYFYQKDNHKLLTQVPNAIKKLASIVNKQVVVDTQLLGEYLGREATPAEIESVKFFINFETRVFNHLAKNFTAKPVQHSQTDLVNHLASNGVLDRNIASAMAVSIYEHLAKEGLGIWTPNDQLAKLHGMKKDTVVNNKFTAKYGKLGGFKISMSEDIGKSIVKQLGLDTRDEASIADLGRLQNSLGALAVQVMIDLNHETQKLVNVTKVPMGDYLVDISYQSTPKNFTAKHNLAMQQLSAIDRKNLELAAQKNGINLNTFNLVKLRRESKQPNGRPIPSNFLAEYRKLLNNPTSVAPMEFIKSNVVKDKDANVANDKMLARILADHKATPKLMTELFGAINYTQTPVFEKPESLDTRLKNRDGFSTVPVEQQENLIKSMANGYKLREGLVNGLNHLYKNNTAFMKQLLGIGTAKDLENYHIDNRENIESTWDSKWMSFVKGIEWAGNVEDKTKEFYMGNEVWAQNRIGYTTNTFNPQLDSLHRAMAGMSDYTDTVDPSQDMMDADGMPTLFGYYLLGVSEGIEKAPLKFETEGLNYSAAATTGENRLAVDFLPYFKEYIDSEAVKEAALLFGKVLNQETITTEQQQKILDILDEFGTGNHSIGSLYHLSLYHAANGKPFEHSVGNSSDGKNNGIYSSQVQLGYLNDADGFAAGGLHVEDIETQEAISRGMRDIYERGAGISIRAMRAIVPTGIADGVIAQVSKAIHGLDKSYGTRKGFKVIMTPFNYAAGIARLAEAVVDKSMATINESFEAVHKGDMELKDALSPINNLLQAYNKMNASIKPLDTKAKFEEINEFYQTMYLRTLSFSVSSDVEEIITQPSPYITDADGNSEVAFSNIKQLSKFINANFTGANTEGSTKSVTDFLNEHFKNELNKTKGSTDYVRISEIEKVGVLNFRLTNQQEEALVSMLNLTRGIATVNTMVSYKPFMEVRNQITQRAGRMFAIYDTLHTAYYAKAVDGLDKTDSTPEISHVTKAQHREIEAKLNRYIPRLMPATNMNNRKDTKANLVAVKSALKYDVTETSRTVARYKSLRDGDTHSFTLGNSYRANIHPGVGMLAAAAQSMDALVASDTMGHFSAFNAHDSATVSGRNAKEAFIHQNKVYFKALSEYHIELEFFNSEIQMFRNLVSAYEKGDLNIEDLKGLYDSTFDKKTQTGLSEYVGKTVQYNLQEARDRLNTRMDMLINQIKSVHQFTGIGGKYNITEADIANLKLVKEKANKDIDKLAKEYTQVAVTLHGYIDTNVTTDSFDSELANGSMDTGRLADYLLEKGYGTNSLVDIIKDAGKHVNFNIKMMDETDAISYSALGIKGKSSFFDATSNTLWINSNVPVNKRMHLVVKKAAVVSLRNRLNVLRKNPSKENIELLDNLTKDTRSIIKAMRESGDIGILQDIKDVNASVFTNIEETVISLLANKKVVDFASNQQADRATVNARVKLWKSMESLVNRVLKLFGLGKVREVKDIDLFNLLKTDTQVSIREANQYAHSIKKFDINTMDSEIALGNRKHTGKLYRDFIANSKAPLSDLLQVFRDTLVAADSKTAAVYSVLLDTIDNHLDNNTVVRVISTAKELQEYIGSIPLTDLESLHPSISTGRAYYYPRNKEVVLFALNNSNSDVSINPEVVIHELFHAVTADKLTKDTQSVKDITVLREKLIAGNYIEDIAAVVGSDLASDYKYALTNNDEFISTILASPILANALARISHEPVSMDDFSKRISKVMDIRNDNVLAAYYNYVGRLLNTNMDTDVVKQPTVHNAPPSNIASTSGSKVKGMTPHEVYEQLGGTDTRIKEVFDMYLEPMLAAIDPALITGVDGVKVWNKAMRNGKAVYASTLVSSGFQLSDAEMYAAEVIEVAMNESFNNNAESMAYRELFKTYEAAQRDIKPEDLYSGVWANATQQEKDIAQKQWDFVFKPSKADANANRYLSRFVALTIASPEFANTLDRVAEEDPSLSELSGFDRVVKWFSKLVEWMFDMSTGTRAYDTYKDNINTMADKLADIDSRYRNRANGIWLEEKWQEVDDKVSNMFGGFANKNALFTKLSNMKLLKNNIIGSITGIAGRSDTIDALPSEVNKTIDALSPNQYLGTMRSILTEIGKYTDTQKMVNGFLSLTKNHEQHKQFISEQTRKVILNGFEKKGKKISKQLQTAITYNVLRTDLQVLANHYGNGSLAKLFNNSAYLDTEISKLEKTVAKHNYGKDKLTQAKKLADFMVTGNARTGMVTNPSAIAAGWGTSYKSNNFSTSESNEIDRLISMYALRDQIARTNPKHITAIVEELNRSPDNGITRAIEIHSRLVKESKELFLDNPMSYVKGYMPDIVNKNIELQSVPVSKRAELEKKGWQYVTDLHPDTVDTNIEPMVLMLIPDSGVQRVTSGALVLSDTGRKGTDNNSDMQASIKNMIKYMDTQNKKGAVLGGVANGLVPTFDVDGNIIGLRYLMNNATKDNYLQRNNDFSRLLGSMAAMNIDKVYSKQENADLLDALHDDYKANFSKQANQYVEISATAPTAKGREIFRMMSWHSRQHVYNTWPDGKMYVSNRVVDSVFGYVNPSITNMFKKDRDQRNTLEKIITDYAELFIGDTAELRFAQVERAIQDITRTFKDFIVIRNFETMWNNIISNTFLLMTYGVNPVFIAREGKKALQHGLQYRKDRDGLTTALIQLSAGIGDRADLEAKVIKYEEAIKRNPIRSFIEDDHMQSSIVEDVALMADHYEYESPMGAKITELREKYLNETVNNVIDTLLVAPNTPMYKFLALATSEGDFVAKYVIHQWFSKAAPKKDRVSHERALEMAQEAFINYDIPHSATIQYLNNMGVWMFTKYNIRIQKAILYLMANKPGRLAFSAGVMAGILGAPSIASESVLNNIGNPLGFAPTNALSMFGEPLPIKVISDVVF